MEIKTCLAITCLFLSRGENVKVLFHKEQISVSTDSAQGKQKKKEKKKKDLKITHKTILKTTCFYMVTKTFTLKFTKGAGGAHVSCPISSVSKWSYKSYLYLILLFMMLLF